MAKKHPDASTIIKETSRSDKGTEQRITGLEEGLDRRENEGRAIQRQ